jgi:hypothetical protein
MQGRAMGLDAGVSQLRSGLFRRCDIRLGGRLLVHILLHGERV